MEILFFLAYFPSPLLIILLCNNLAHISFPWVLGFMNVSMAALYDFCCISHLEESYLKNFFHELIIYKVVRRRISVYIYTKLFGVEPAYIYIYTHTLSLSLHDRREHLPITSWKYNVSVSCLLSNDVFIFSFFSSSPSIVLPSRLTSWLW